VSLAPIRLITLHRILLHIHMGTSRLRDVTFQNGDSKNLRYSVTVYFTSLSVSQLRSVEWYKSQRIIQCKRAIMIQFEAVCRYLSIWTEDNYTNLSEYSTDIKTRHLANISKKYCSLRHLRVSALHSGIFTPCKNC
jgi:hypothetical protein